ncbi:MAG: peptidase [Gammaproteobacteria bacterium]|nr:MAG: peptidase [Gammaproteobacteria bacterium]
MKVRSDISRTYLSLHTWVGICSGLLLFIGFFAGSLTMFKAPIDRWLSPPAQQINALDNLADIDSLVSQFIQQYPDARDGFNLYLNHAENVAPISWKKSGPRSHQLQFDSKRWQASLNEQGELYTQVIQPSILAKMIDMLHQTAGIPFVIGGEYLGVYLMGVAAVLYFLALVSGLILLLPTLMHNFFAVRQKKNKKRFWLDSHNLVGITSFPFHVIISMTVIVFAFHDLFYGGLEAVVYGDETMFGPRSENVAEPYDLKDILPATQLIKRIEKQVPEFEVQRLKYQDLETTRASIRASIISPDHMARGAVTSYIAINPYTGVIDSSWVPAQGNNWNGTVTSFFALHFGSYGGNVIRWVYFFLGLAGAFLFYSGNLLWLESRRKKQIKGEVSVKQARNTRWMASATVGISLGSVAGVILAMVAGKWFYAFADNINYASLNVYYGIFLAAVAWAFIRGAASAAVHLLYLCALACLAIPLTTLSSLLWPEHIWANTSLTTLSVDFTGLLFALFFFKMATLTTKRANQGDKDSVWSVKN